MIVRKKLLLLLLLQLSFFNNCYCSTSTDSPKKQKKDEVRKNVEHIRTKLKNQNFDFSKARSDYNHQRGSVLRDKVRYIKKAIKELADDDNFSNKVQKHAEALRRFNAKFVSRYVRNCSIILSKLNEEIGLLRSEREKLLKFVNDSPDFKRSHFEAEFLKLDLEIAAAHKYITAVRAYKAHLESIIYGTMCFDVIGANSRIDTKKEEEQFQELTLNVIEIACGELGIDADLVLMKILKQRFIINSSRRLRTRNLQEFGKVRDFVLRVGTVIGIICECKEESLISDVWSRRTRNLLEEEDEEEEMFGSSRNSTALQSQQQQQQQDYNDEQQHHVLDSQAAAAAATEDNNNNTSIIVENQVFHHDAFYVDEDRHLLGATGLEQKYIKALNRAFQSLNQVIEVKQVSCEGFLSETDAIRYIYGLI